MLRKAAVNVSIELDSVRPPARLLSKSTVMSGAAWRGDGHFVNRFAVGPDRTARGATHFKWLVTDLDGRVDVWLEDLRSEGFFHVPSDSDDPVSSDICRRFERLYRLHPQGSSRVRRIPLVLFDAWKWGRYCLPKRLKTPNQRRVVTSWSCLNLQQRRCIAWCHSLGIFKTSGTKTCNWILLSSLQYFPKASTFITQTFDQTQIVGGGSQSVVQEPLEDGAIFFCNNVKRRNILLAIFNIIQNSLPGIATTHNLNCA